MICRVCGNNKFHTIFVYTGQDKYELLANLNGGRSWARCAVCRFYTQKHAYNRELLYKVYEKDYRTKVFRGESIGEVFNKTYNLPYGKSENRQRFRWFRNHIGDGWPSVIDIGSGFGIWPYQLLKYGYPVSCTEWNEDSIEFISEELRIRCEKDQKDLKDKADVVSCINVLEHSANPEEMLHSFKDLLTDEGKIFLEVPDADEFTYLPKDHEEFNSTHFHFFDVPNLYRMVSWVGYKVKSIEKIHYRDRNLKRILMVADAP